MPVGRTEWVVLTISVDGHLSMTGRWFWQGNVNNTSFGCFRGNYLARALELAEGTLAADAVVVDWRGFPTNGDAARAVAGLPIHNDTAPAGTMERAPLTGEFVPYVPGTKLSTVQYVSADVWAKLAYMAGARVYPPENLYRANCAGFIK
jgi:hypothetical protein